MTTWKVTLEEAGTRLPHFIQSRLSDKPSLKEIKKSVEENGCHVNKKLERFSSYLVREGDVIAFSAPESKKIEILYQDDTLAIVNKPAFIVSDADKGLLGWKLAHRLDKETSGCLLLAKTPQMEAALMELFRLRAVHKEYMAVVDKAPLKMSGTIEDPIDGKTAKTKWKRGQKGKKVCWIHCFPETGRTHQIRIHLATHGMAILGDWKYGKSFNSSYQTKRILLHSAVIEFIHPLTKQLIRAEAPLPKEFYEALSG